MQKGLPDVKLKVPSTGPIHTKNTRTFLKKITNRPIDNCTNTLVQSIQKG